MIYLIATKTQKVTEINKRVDHSQKTFQMVRTIWNWLCSMNGAEGNENHIGIQRFEFGSAWQERVKQLLLCQLI